MRKLAAKFDKELGEILEQYSDEIKKDLVETTDRIAKEAVNELKNSSPKKTGKYAKGWAIKKEKNARIIYNKDFGSLTHLLEYGHATRNGGRTMAFPHIQLVESKINDSFETEIKKVLNK